MTAYIDDLINTGFHTSHLLFCNQNFDGLLRRDRRPKFHLSARKVILAMAPAVFKKSKTLDWV
jgi:hypothetical protein